MFSLAYVILPFESIAPATAIQESLARFERGGRGQVPDDWLAFHDEGEAVREAHEASLTFVDQGKDGLALEGDWLAAFYIDRQRVKAEMQRRKLQRWTVRFCDEVDLVTFFDGFVTRLERDPATGRFGRWLNPCGRWDWWDLGGRFDGHIIGDPGQAAARCVSQISSGASAGRMILENVADTLRKALGTKPPTETDVRGDRNIELVTTLLADGRAERPNSRPGALVLPPGAVEDRMRWVDAWPRIAPEETVAWLGLPHGSGWAEIVQAVYGRFEGHWAAGIAYHL
jgi:hypothetical protein